MPKVGPPLPSPCPTSRRGTSRGAFLARIMGVLPGNAWSDGSSTTMSTSQFGTRPACPVTAAPRLGQRPETRLRNWPGRVKVGAMASGIDVGHLLYELCTELGFSLTPEAQARLIEDPSSNVDTFTDAVLVAEGLDPVIVQKRIRLRVQEVVARHWAGES